MQARLVLVTPAAAAREFKLNLPTTIGRSRDAKLKLVHGQVSRLHCEIFDRGGLLYVRDLGSTNGTFVNDERVVDELPLPPGGSLMLGTVALRALYGEFSDELLPPGMAIAPDTVRAAPQEETFRVTDPEQLSEAQLAESPFGFAEFESFADDPGVPIANSAHRLADFADAPLGEESSPFDWLGEPDPTATAPPPTTAPKPPTATQPSPKQLPSKSAPAIASNKTPDGADFNMPANAELELDEEIELLPLDELSAEPTAEFGANSVDERVDQQAQREPLLYDAAEPAADQQLANMDSADGITHPQHEAPNYFPPEQADPTPLDDKRWRVPDELAAPAATTVSATAVSATAVPRAAKPAASPTAPTTPALPPPVATPANANPKVDDDLENFFNSFQ